MSTNKHSDLSVKSKSPNGFRRAGWHFTREATLFAAGELTDAQYQAIKNEPNLVVTESGETEAQRIAREKAEAKAAEKAAAQANTDALAREKKATGNKDGKAAWEAATTAARAAAGLDDAAWSALPASDRVARIEANLAEAAK